MNKLLSPFFSLILLLALSNAQAQDSKADSLKAELQKEHPDTTRVNILSDLALQLMYSKPDKAKEYVDRALKVADKSESKKHIAKAHHSLGLYHFTQGNHSKCLKSWKEALRLRKASELEKAAIASLGNIGVVHENQGKYPKALEYYNKALKRAKKNGYQKLMANNHGNMGVVYAKKGVYPKALEHYFDALKIAEKLGDKSLMANNLGNIGSIYKEQGAYKKALEQYERTLKLAEELQNKRIMANTLGSIGTVHRRRGNFSESLGYYSRAYRIREELGDKQGMANSLDNLGTLYIKAYKRGSQEEGRTDSTQWEGRNGTPLPYGALLDSASSCQEKAYSIRKSIGDQRGKTYSLNAMGQIRLLRGKPNEALSFFRRSYALADSIGTISRKMESAQELYRAYKELANSDSALAWHERYTAYKDSVFNEKKQKELGRQQTRYKFQKKLLKQRKEQEKQAAIAEERNRRQRVISYSAIGGLLMALAFAFFIANRLRVTRRQKRLIEEQKQTVEEQKRTVEEQKRLVEEKNQEITDSINYAKRLQDAVQPPNELLNAHLEEHFILYKPKEIVSGDFYFMEVVQEKEKKLVYYVAADCTGHGVPGAMVSILGANGLKRCIQEFELRKPGDILGKLSELVAENFYQQEDEQIRDGMDLALCCLEYEGEAAKRVYFAGANNPLWLVNPQRTDWPEAGTPFKEGGGIEFPATRKAIGYTEDPAPFDSQSIELQDGDALYTFSDGYPDQFGGEKGKKFKSAQFKKLLVSIHEKEMPEQKRILDDTFEEWKGNLEQVDDICVIGVKV